MGIAQDRAEEAAIRVLAWLVGNDELLPVFLGASGAGAEDLRAGATDPAFLGSVLDFVLMDDAWVIACGDATGLPYDSLSHIRQSLPGGALPHWT